MRGKECSQNSWKKLPSAILYLINIFLVVLVLNILSNNLGILNISILYYFSIFIFFAIILLNVPIKNLILSVKKRKNIEPITIVVGFILLFISLFLLIFFNEQFLWIVCVSLFLSGLFLILLGIGIVRKELHLLSIASFAYALFYIFLNSVSSIWLFFQSISLNWSTVIGSLVNKSLLLGPSISGLWIIIPFIILIITSLILSFTKRQILWSFLNIIGLIIAWTFYNIFIGITIFESKSDVVHYHFILFIICTLGIYIYFAKYQYKDIISNPIHQLKIKSLIKNTKMWALFFLFISSILLTTNIQTNEQGNKILFYGQNQLGTWDTPEYGKYGREAYGMFGLLPIYLKASGFESTIIVENITTFLNSSQPVHENITRFVNISDYVNLIESPKITDDILQDFNVLVVTNLNLSFSLEETNRIWKFVKSGGSLLVLGDHTNVGEIQKPINDLLGPSGIKLRFDSALPMDVRSKWLNCYQLFNHPIISKIKDLDEIQISVGASLDAPQAIPIVIGRYALSDEGDRTNEDMAYLGDYEYNQGEQIGDIILVAGMHYDKGKVLVFGDTSTFQNSALPYSFYFIQQIFNWLTEEGAQNGEYIQFGISLIFLILAIIFYFFKKTKHVIFGLFPLILCSALLISTVILPIIQIGGEINGNIVYIDTTHNERFSIEPFTDDSINGLMLNLNRNGFLPLFLRDFTRERVKEVKILIFNAPTKSFSAEEVDLLAQYMYQGGIVVLATGYEDKDASNLLLDKFELEIEGIPLGPVPYVEFSPEEYENEPKFVDSWPIIYQKENAKPYYNFTWDRDYNLMVFVEHGGGGLLLVADSQYLLDRNIESIYDYWPGNIIFLKHILDDFQERGDVG